MNNYIFGYLAKVHYSNSKAILEKIAVKYDIGLKEILPEQLFQFTTKYLPNKNETNFIFSITDSPDSEEANYLIDYLDYAPEIQTKFPPLGINRLQILISILQEMANQTKCARLVISLTDSGYIYSYKRLKSNELAKTLLADFAVNQGAPDTLYEFIYE